MHKSTLERPRSPSARPAVRGHLFMAGKVHLMNTILEAVCQEPLSTAGHHYPRGQSRPNFDRGPDRNQTPDFLDFEVGNSDASVRPVGSAMQ
jgi:hypothetical protein